MEHVKVLAFYVCLTLGAAILIVKMMEPNPFLETTDNPKVSPKATFQVGQCVVSIHHLERWETPWTPMKILEVGERGYRARFVTDLNGRDVTIYFVEEKYRKVVPCPGTQPASLKQIA